ncbi:hypothetical protein IWQ62_003673 [Dispira parvispora]|uniref:Uncharacterized protein n=1 Tax=Dispira parvispora TaxID=1520584 RepID=A0A9W8ATQ6_9FUNG|nr:hypothetical protein IWQ62_003673 [Dispira parvispora]
MFCIYKLLTQHGFRKRFQLSMYTTIFFHLIFFMIAPRETLFSRSQLIIHSLSWSSMHVTFFLLIYRWAQVAQNIYHTRWFKVYFVVMYGYAVVIVLWLIASIVATYEAGQGRIGGTFVAVCRIYLTGSYLVVILVFFSILAFWVVVNQWKFYRTSAGASSLIRLSLFTVFVAIGWLVQVISLSLVMTIWAKPYIKNFVAQSVLFCLVNFWITIVVFWQMPLSSAGTSRNFWSSNSRSNPTPFKDNSDNTYALPSTLDKARGNLLENKADFYGPTERQSFEEVIGSTPLDSQKTVQSQPRGNNANSLDNWPTDLHLPATVLASSYELKQII